MKKYLLIVIYFIVVTNAFSAEINKKGDPLNAKQYNFCKSTADNNLQKKIVIYKKLLLEYKKIIIIVSIISIPIEVFCLTFGTAYGTYILANDYAVQTNRIIAIFMLGTMGGFIGVFGFAISLFVIFYYYKIYTQIKQEIKRLDKRSSIKIIFDINYHSVDIGLSIIF